MSDFFEVQDLPLAEDFYETVALKTAVWQYIIDHASPSAGFLKVYMVAKDADDFWRRVSARKYARYSRADSLKLRQQCHSRGIEYQHLKRRIAMGDKNSTEFEKLRVGTLMQKVRYYAALFLRRIANKIASHKSPTNN